MAQQLHSSGEQVALLALIDSSAPQRNSHLMEVDTAATLAWFAKDLGSYFGKELAVSVSALQSLAPDEQLSYVLERARAAKVVLPDAGVVEIGRLLEVVLANRQAERSYTPVVYPNQITVFRAEEWFGLENSDPTMGWNQLTEGGVKIHAISGDHYTIVKEPHVRVLAERLRNSIEQAHSDRPFTSWDSQGASDKRIVQSVVGHSYSIRSHLKIVAVKSDLPKAAALEMSPPDTACDSPSPN
jgi:thioesterase domain-containing protein